MESLEKAVLNSFVGGILIPCRIPCDQGATRNMLRILDWQKIKKSRVCLSLRCGEIHFELYSVLDCDTPSNIDFVVIFLIFHCIVLYYASLDSKAVNTLNAVLCVLVLPRGMNF